MDPLGGKSPVLLGLDLAAWIQTIIGGIFGGLAGYVASLRANRAYHDWLAPIFEMDVDASDLAPKPPPPSNSWTYFHVILSAPAKIPGWRGRFLGDRRVPKEVTAKVRILDAGTQTVQVDEPARWVSWPRPISHIPVQPAPPAVAALAPYFDEQEASRLESRDFKSTREPERLDLVVKVEGDPNLYFWNNLSYLAFNTYTLGPGTYDVQYTIHCEGKPWVFCFRLSNDGPSWADVGIEKIPCPKT